MSAITLCPLTDQPHIRKALSELLVETVASGGSVSFMHPLPPEDAGAFWRESLAAAARGERVGRGAFDGESVVATVTSREVRLDHATAFGWRKAASISRRTRT